MSGPRRYPAEVAGPFPTPPRTFADREGREITLRAHDDAAEEVQEALVEMYVDFDPADRAQGIPPVGEERIRAWVDTLLDGSDDRGRSGYNVLAWHDDRVVGHATLVYDSDETYELAIFVHQTYQGAGIGTHLIEALLGHGAEEGVETVWLTVERWNRAAVNLYEKVGFETTDAQSFDREMAIRLAEGED